MQDIRDLGISHGPAFLQSVWDRWSSVLKTSDARRKNAKVRVRRNVVERRVYNVTLNIQGVDRDSDASGSDDGDDDGGDDDGKDGAERPVAQGDSAGADNGGDAGAGHSGDG